MRSLIYPLPLNTTEEKLTGEYINRSFQPDTSEHRVAIEHAKQTFSDERC